MTNRSNWTIGPAFMIPSRAPALTPTFALEEEAAATAAADVVVHADVMNMIRKGRGRVTIIV